MEIETNLPESTPDIVGQALACLDRMDIHYRYRSDAGLWEFLYDGLYLLLLNDCKDNELGIYAPVFIVDSEDEEIRKMVYECSESAIEMELSSGCDFGYDGDGVCHVAGWWEFQCEKPRLTLKEFEAKLEEIHERQLKICCILHETYEMMFNPPGEVIEEILKNKTKDNPDE